MGQYGRYDGYCMRSVRTCTYQNGNPVLRKFLVREHHKLAAIMQQLRTQDMSDSIMDRIEQINEMMAYNEAAYSTMGAIRNAGI